MPNCLFLNGQSRPIADHAMTIILTAILPQCLVFTEAFGKPTFLVVIQKKIEIQSPPKKRKKSNENAQFPFEKKSRS